MAAAPKGLERISAGGFQLELISSDLGIETAMFSSSDGKTYMLHSVVDPIREANELIKSVDTSKSSLYVVFGTGLGYHLKALQAAMTPSSRAIVLEPYEDFLDFWEKKEVVSKLADKRFTFIAGDLQALQPKLDNLMRGQNIMVASNLRFVVLPAYARAFREWVKETEMQLISLIKNRVFEMGNDVADTLQGIRQIMYNLGELVCSVGAKNLEEAYQGKPAIIVSAGPSLNKNVDLLHKVKGKALILCVDASLNILLQKGIMPDAVFSIERGIETYNHFYKDRVLPSEPVLIAPPVVYPNIFDEFPGEKVVLFRKNEGVNMWFEGVLRRGMVAMGTSVAHLAFGFANLVKADPIIFIGQDLAYSVEGYTHGEGVAIADKADLSKVEEWVEGYDGQPLPSSRVLKYFLTWFETAIAETDVLCIDATEGGARIKGTEIMTFQEAIDAYCRGGCIQPLRDIVMEKKQQSTVDEDLNKVLSAYRELISFFEDIENKAKEGIELLNKVEKDTNFLRATRGKLLKVVRRIKANDAVVQQIFRNPVAVMIFQTMVFMVNQQLADMGDKLTCENVQNNIKVQRWLLERLSQVSFKVKEELETVLEKTAEKLKEQNMLQDDWLSTGQMA